MTTTRQLPTVESLLQSSAGLLADQARFLSETTDLLAEECRAAKQVIEQMRAVASQRAVQARALLDDAHNEHTDQDALKGRVEAFLAELAQGAKP